VKKIILLLLALTIPAVAHAEEPLVASPSWSLELKGGTFAPSLQDWSQYYGKKDMPAYAATLAYKVVRQIEIGVGGGAARDRGQAYAPLHSAQSGNAYLSGGVTTKLYPLDVFILFRAIFNEDQWVVPYIGGGWTRIYYRQTVEGQGEVRGSADGYHFRGGLQLSLDNIDESAADNLYDEDGVYHTYFFVEAERTKAKVRASSIDLGGTAYLMGLLFEF
jgi:hypothetical protein